VYTPEIYGIPNILQAKDELEAAQAFAFVVLTLLAQIAAYSLLGRSP
jgi:hypothetical protein